MTLSTEEVQLSHDGDVAEIVINRPRKRNAMRGEDWVAMARHLEEVSKGGARALLIRGEGVAFSAGYDIGDLDPGHVDAQAIIENEVNPTLRALRDLAIPTVAAVTGDCVGGGLAIAAACDIVIGGEGARFGSPYSRIGIMTDGGLHLFLRDLLGHQRAAYLIFTGKLISAREAQALGLCCEVHPDGELLSRARGMAGQLAAGPTRAICLSKSILRNARTADEALDLEARYQAEVFATEDAKAGISAFKRGERAVFAGR